MSSDELSVTFKMPADMYAFLDNTSKQIDKTKSEILRCCFLLSVDTIRTTPNLVHRIQFDDRTDKKQ